MLKSFQAIFRKTFYCLLISLPVNAATWTPPVNISSPVSQLGAPSLGMDAAGNSVAVWVQTDGVNNVIQAATLPMGGTWSAPQTISTLGQSSDQPRVAVAANGNAVAVWSRFDGVDTRIQSASLPFGGTWSAISTLSPAGFLADSPDVSVDPNGNAVAAWRQNDGANDVIVAAQYPFGGVWGAPTTLSLTGQNAFPPDVAVAANGDATVVWSRFDGANFIVQATTSVGGIWPPPGGIDLSAAGQDSLNPVLDIAPSGYAVAAWEGTDGVNARIQAATQIAPNVWTAAQNISPAGVDSFVPDVAVDQNGNAILIWNASLVNLVNQSSSLLFGSLVWSPVENASPVGQTSGAAKIAVDANGNAIATWIFLDLSGNLIVQSAMHPFGGSWEAPDTLSTSGQDSQIPQVVILSPSYAVIIWFNDTLDVVQGVNISTTPFPPSDFVGKVRKNKFLNRTEYVLRATWQASSSPDLVAYRIYKNGVVVATVSASSPLVFRTDVHSKKAARLYELAAVNSNGLESNHVPIRIINE